ncbi:hypothetical protein [Emticicia sp. W12TSBA100-4]|uniref:hypothetical protein n=1 Tax=Emticicia sp. W12TSBA100-4 TaxID=3160965 RepID=UPI0033056C67
MEQTLSDLAKLSPVIAVMCVIIFFLYKRLTERETTLENRLNEKDKMFLDIHTKAVDAIHNNTNATNALTELIKERPARK